ncbi:MAG TPA: hypothetical protein VMT46_17965 [Anaerolineaceae bacterium]|nr:hypothetical protein [Anaerolineaceae bacterium]
MKRNPWWKDFLNVWVVLGGLALAGLLIVLVWLMLVYLRAPASHQLAPTAEVVIVPAPTLTPNIVLPDLPPTPTPTLQTVPQQAGGPISIGIYVQISGTGGDGLRLREQPGKSGALKFLGAESEVFQVKDGPHSADGLTWWYLVAPYDANRNGWAAADFLAVIQTP